MDRQTLRDWVHRYNREGLAGLRDRHGGGCGTKLSPAQRAELTALVEAGPDPTLHKVVRWRRVDLRDEIKRRFGVDLHGLCPRWWCSSSVASRSRARPP
jgi:transposase